MTRRFQNIFRLVVWVGLFVLMIALTACSTASDEMQDGYYTAEMAEYDEHGWKELLVIYVKDNEIISVEYEAKNASGFIKSWDMDYMRTMNETDGTYPNEYVRTFSEALINRQNSSEVDAISGATHSYNTFKLLAEAAMEQARAGETSIAFVESPSYE